jgi:hypothetical protein
MLMTREVAVADIFNSIGPLLTFANRRVFITSVSPRLTVAPAGAEGRDLKVVSSGIRRAGA